MSTSPLPFVTAAQAQIEQWPWCRCEWLCRPGLVASEHILLVRAEMPPGMSHQFHHHPTMEEIIYVLEGRAEQWVGREPRILSAGEVAHIPTGTIHGTYNPFDETLRFLAILSPARFAGPAVVDVFREPPWCILKTPIDYGV